MKTKIILEVNETEFSLIKEVLKMPKEQLSRRFSGLLIESLELPTRVENSLKKAGYYYVSEIKDAILSGEKYLKQARGIGEKSFSLIKNACIEKKE